MSILMIKFKMQCQTNIWTFTY